MHEHRIPFEIGSLGCQHRLRDRVVKEIKTSFPGQDLGLSVPKVQAEDALAEHFVPAKLKNEIDALHHIGIGELALAAQDLDGSFNRAIVRSLGEGREEPDRPNVNDLAWMRKWRDPVVMEHGRD